MRAIGRRLLKLEKALAPAGVRETDWGEMAHTRDELFRLAEQRGPPHVAQLREELEALGPAGLWLEAARIFLGDHGFVQTVKESFAETIARALDISGYELSIWIAQRRVGAALLDRFKQPAMATDNWRITGQFPEHRSSAGGDGRIKRAVLSGCSDVQ